MSKFAPKLSLNMWPEVIADIDQFAIRHATTRTAVSRFAVGQFMDADPGDRTRFPVFEDILPLYPSISSDQIAELPVLAFQPEYRAAHWLRALKEVGVNNSLADMARHIIAYQVPRL